MNLIKMYLIARYDHVGKKLGDALSYSYVGKPNGFDQLVKKYLSLEKKIVKYGYRPRNLNEFIGAGGYGRFLVPLERITNQINVQQILNDNQSILNEARSIQSSGILKSIL